MAKRVITREKNCYCHTCKRDIHYLGINSHRAAHRRRFEDCKITYTYGDTYTFAFSESRPTKRALDVCPRCDGKKIVLDGLVTGKCLSCNGTGKRQ